MDRENISLEEFTNNFFENPNRELIKELIKEIYLDRLPVSNMKLEYMKFLKQCLHDPV